MIITILAFIIVLGILIFFHELGHFLMAKASGVGVLKFSLGFGPALIKMRFGETEYQLAAFPLGGYVKMLGEDPDDKDQLTHIDPEKSFSRKGLGAKAAIVFSGPFFNFLLAVVILTVIAWVGVPYLLPVVGGVQKDSPADKAGLLPGDRIQTIENKQIFAFEDISTSLQNSVVGKSVEIELMRDSKVYVLHVTPIIKMQKNLFGEQIPRFIIGISPYDTVLGEIDKGSPADKAGLKSGDRVVAVAQTPMDNWEDIQQKLQDIGAGKNIEIEVTRDGKPTTLHVVPEMQVSTSFFGKKHSQVIIGISPKEREVGKKRYGPLAGIGYGFGRCYKIIELTGIAFGKMIKGTISAKDSLGGPIQIAQVSGQTFREGPLAFISLIAFISINLAIINLMPIPVLDGGYLLLFLIEGITGKPVEGKPRELAQQIGLFILIMLMLFAFYNDITRIFKG